MYITPRVLIQQEFVQLPVYAEFPLPAFILGPHYALTRYSEPSERPFTALNTLDGEFLLSGNSYIPNTDTRYSFSNIPAGGNVDHTYTKVFAESVEAKYFPNEDLSTDDIEGATVAELVQAPSGRAYPNRFRLPNVILRTADGYVRSQCFSNRNVSIGDIATLTDDRGNVVKGRITGLYTETAAIDGNLNSTIAEVIKAGADGVTNGSRTFTSAGSTFSTDLIGKYITIANVPNTAGAFKIIASPDNHTLLLDREIAAGANRVWSIGGAYNNPSNAGRTTADFNVSPTSVGTENNTVSATNTSTAYVGYAAKRILEDTYTFTVTSGTSAADVKFSISSASGAFTTKTEVSLIEGDLTIDNNNGNQVYVSFTEQEEGTPIVFSVGNSWTLGTLTASVVPVIPATSGEYTGAIDATYTLRVDRGGAFYDGSNGSTCARLVISSSDIDTTSIVLPRAEEFFSVGTRGIMASFNNASNNGGLILGDVYYIPATAERVGKTTIVELSESLPEAMLELATSITAELMIVQRSIRIPEVRDLLTGETNWSQEDAYITINSGITTYDNMLLDNTSTPARLPISSAKLFVEHRDLLQDYVNSIDSVRSLADVSKLLGTVHPDNPLAQGVYDAVLNAQNMVVYFIAVETDDLLGYNKAIKISEKSDKVYSFVPMSFDRMIQDAVISHVNAFSTPERGRWRIAWIAAKDTKTSLIYDLKEDGSPYQGTIVDDPAVTGVQNKLVTIDGAQFIEDGVRPNDTVRINFRLSPDGKVVYDEYVVDRVRTNTTLLLTKSLPIPINVPTKIQVIRNYTQPERAENIAAISGSYHNRRVRVVFPDTYKYGSIVKQGYFAAAGLAGLRSGVVPHQGLTNSEFYGGDDLSKVVFEFTSDELNTMAEKGVWIITQEVIGATAYVRHQLTSDMSGLNTSEDSITTNVDNISYALKKTLTPFIGRYNINPNNILAVYAAVVAELKFRATNTSTERAGNQLVSFTPAEDIINISQNETYRDIIDVEVRLHVPYPVNFIKLKLVVGDNN